MDIRQLETCMKQGHEPGQAIIHKTPIGITVEVPHKTPYDQYVHACQRCGLVYFSNSVKG